MDLRGKVAIITGAAGGIGKETARQMADAGARVTLVDLHLDAITEAANQLGFNAEQYVAVAADVSKEEDVKKFVDETMNKFGRVDILFNNAGIEGKFSLIKDTTVETLDLVLNVNVKGVFYGMKHVIPIMTEQKSGSIINNSSVAGHIGFPGLAPYTASKHAVIGLTKAAALEVAETGVRVNAICPAPINTRMMRAVEAGAAPDAPDAVKEQFTAAIPLKRYGEVEETAKLVLFLASDDSQFITGSAYLIDGGMVAH